MIGQGRPIRNAKEAAALRRKAVALAADAITDAEWSYWSSLAERLKPGQWQQLARNAGEARTAVAAIETEEAL